MIRPCNSMAAPIRDANPLIRALLLLGLAVMIIAHHSAPCFNRLVQNQFAGHSSIELAFAGQCDRGNRATARPCSTSQDQSSSAVTHFHRPHSSLAGRITDGFAFEVLDLVRCRTRILKLCLPPPDE